VADPAGAQEQGVEQVVIGRVAVAERLAGVEEEGNLDALHGALLPEPEELGKQVGQGAAVILGANEVVAGDEVRPGELGGDAVVHALDDGARVVGPERGPDDAEAPERLALLCGFEPGRLLLEDLEHLGGVSRTSVARWVYEPLEDDRGGEEGQAKSDLGWADEMVTYVVVVGLGHFGALAAVIQRPGEAVSAVSA